MKSRPADAGRGGPPRTPREDSRRLKTQGTRSLDFFFTLPFVSNRGAAPRICSEFPARIFDRAPIDQATLSDLGVLVFCLDSSLQFVAMRSAISLSSSVRRCPNTSSYLK
jgi:hypothetical protein